MAKKAAKRKKSASQMDAPRRAAVRAPARGLPGVKKTKKKSFIVIAPPAGVSFPAATKVTRVRRLSPALEFTFTFKQFPSHLLVSVKGPNDRAKGRVFDDTPDPGELTITLSDQGPDIEPIVTVPVVFVDEFDAGP